MTEHELEMLKKLLGENWKQYSTWDTEKEPYLLRFNLPDNDLTKDELRELRDELQNHYHHDQRVNIFSENEIYEVEAELEQEYIEFKFWIDDSYKEANTTIKVSEYTKDLIYEFKERTESYNDTIVRLLEEFKSSNQ